MYARVTVGFLKSPGKIMGSGGLLSCCYFSMKKKKKKIKGELSILMSEDICPNNNLKSNYN